MIPFISPVRVNGSAARLLKGLGSEENQVTEKQEMNRQGGFLFLYFLQSGSCYDVAAGCSFIFNRQICEWHQSPESARKQLY